MHLYIASSAFGCRFGISNIQGTFDKKNHEMKLGLQSYAVIIRLANSCISFKRLKPKLV
jgi:hypothetical protein